MAPTRKKHDGGEKAKATAARTAAPAPAPAAPRATAAPAADAAAAAGAAPAAEGAPAGTEAPKASSAGSPRLDSEAAPRGFVSQMGTVLLKAAVAGTRNVLVPMAEMYAPDPERQYQPSENSVFSTREQATLRRAASKLMCEVGQILVANYPVTPAGGTPDCGGETSTNAYRAPSVAHVLAAFKAATGYVQARAEQKAVAERVAAARERNQQRAPVPVSSLRRTQR